MMAGGREFDVTEVGAYRPGGYNAHGRADGRRGGLYRRVDQGHRRHPRGRHHHPRRPPCRRAAARLQARAAHGVLRHLSRRRRELRDAQGRAGKAAPERRGALLRAGDVGRRWATASAAAFWGCCTWRSFRSGWSASSISIWSPPRPASSTSVIKTDGDDNAASTTRPTCRPCRRSTTWRSPSWTRRSSRRRNSWARSWSCARTSAAPSAT